MSGEEVLVDIKKHVIYKQGRKTGQKKKNKLRICQNDCGIKFLAGPPRRLEYDTQFRDLSKVPGGIV